MDTQCVDSLIYLAKNACKNTSFTLKVVHYSLSHIMNKYPYKKKEVSNEILSQARIQTFGRKYLDMPDEVKLKTFLFWKIWKLGALKFILELLNCTLGSPNLGLWGRQGSLFSFPGSATNILRFTSNSCLDYCKR